VRLLVDGMLMLTRLLALLVIVMAGEGESRDVVLLILILMKGPTR
jgi:hypothetical protein